MEMTRNILLELLQMHRLQNHQEDFHFSGIELLLDEPVDRNVLYLTDESLFQEYPNVLPLGSRRDINRAFLAVQHYSQWQEVCYRLSNVEHDLNQLINVCASFLGCDLKTISNDYWIDARAGGVYMDRFNYLGRMRNDDVEQLYQDDPDFDETYRLRGLQPYHQESAPEVVLYYQNFFQESLFLGRLVFVFPVGDIHPGKIQLMEQACEYVEVCYRYLYLHRQKEQAETPFYDLWRNILKNEPADHDMVIRSMDSKRWHPDDPFQILHLKSAGYGHSAQTLKYYAVQIEDAFPEMVAAELDGGLYCLRNLAADSSGNFQQKLGEFLRENLFHVGISNPFRDIFSSPIYRFQSEEALRCGTKRNPSLWRYEFSDYVLDMVIDQTLERIPIQDLLPQNLRILMEYDKKHPDSALVETLYQYYTNQFQVQAAADKLFIHRTTFFYRMNKIQKLAPIHTDDLEETCQMMLALLAWKQNTH